MLLFLCRYGDKTMTKLFDTKIHKKNTKLGDIIPLIDKECMANIIGNNVLCILKSINIDTNIWANVYNLQKSQEFIVPVEDLYFEHKE